MSNIEGTVAGSTIVLIEDDDGIRDSMATLLEDEGYVVVQAANGADGLERIRAADELCLVLLDLWMPVMNGWQLLAELRADVRLARIPVVVISAAGEQPPPGGAAAFLRKPVRLDVLLDAVMTHRLPVATGA
jgi:CheY-like chemotaxis protein